MKPRIAVIGMWGNFPGASSPEMLWENILSGRREFRSIPKEKFPLEDYYDSDPSVADKTYANKMAVISDWVFPREKFKIAPIDYMVSDQVHFLALDTTQKAIDDSGVDLEKFDKSNIQVIIGNSLGGEFGRSMYLRYRFPFAKRSLEKALQHTDLSPKEKRKILSRFEASYLAPFPPLNEHSLAGTMSNTIAGRICNWLGIRGGGFAVDGACSSSLLAVAKGCEAILEKRAELVIAGGVDISVDPFELIGFAKAKALAKQDIRPYDQHAEGMLPGEGCGIFVLMDASRASQLGLHPHALIRGWGISSDGAGSLTAPDSEGQRIAMQKAYKMADYKIDSVQLFEGHGTGTPVGDRIELQALISLLKKDSTRQMHYLGSIKGNIGHAKAAAGAAGLIKTILSLERKILPPYGGIQRPNATLNTYKNLIRPLKKGKVWSKPKTNNRRAGISAFGFGGANVHMTVEEFASATQPCSREVSLLSSSQQVELLVISASSKKTLVNRLNTLHDLAGQIAMSELIDLAANLAKNDKSQSLRVALLVQSPFHLKQSLHWLLGELNTGAKLSSLTIRQAGIFTGKVSKGQKKPKIIGLFPGQSAQHPNMCANFLERYPFLSNLYQSFDNVSTDKIVRWSSSLLRYADEKSLKKWRNQLTQTQNAQPAIVAASLATYTLLKRLGITPDYHLGHSLGETSALAAAGGFSFQQAVLMAQQRGKFITTHIPPFKGGMIALGCPEEFAEKLILESKLPLEIANVNSPSQTVICGTSKNLDKFTDFAKKVKVSFVPLKVSHAFHSTNLQPAANKYLEFIKELPVDFPKKKVISSILGKTINSSTNLHQLLSRQITDRVRFVDAVTLAYDEKPDMWIEIGPGSILSKLVKDNIGEDARKIYTTDSEHACKHTQIYSLVAQAYVLGVGVKPMELYRYRFYRPFEEKMYNPIFLINPCEREQNPQKTIEKNDTQNVAFPIEVQYEANVGNIEITNLIIHWISQNLGYSLNTLHPKLRFYNDLNLESIKRLELSQEIFLKFGVQPDSDVDWKDFTINELVQHLIQQTVSSNATPEAISTPLLLADARLNSTNKGSDWINYFTVENGEFSISSEKIAFPPSLIAGIIGSPDNLLVKNVYNYLQDAGYYPELLSTRKKLFKKFDGNRYGALFWIIPNLKNKKTKLTSFARQLFNLGKLMSAHEHGRKNDLKLFIVRQDQSPVIQRPVDAGAAFFKSLQLEHPWIKPKWIVFPLDWKPQWISENLLEELKYEGKYVEYYYTTPHQKRHTRWLSKLKVNPSNQLKKRKKKSIVLITGGAKGITFEISKEWARRYSDLLILAGSSPVDNTEVSKNMATIKAIHPDIYYYQIDLQNASNVKSSINTIQTKFGHINGIVHGAGKTIPTPIKKMKNHQFLQHIRIKALGFEKIVRHLDYEKMNFVYVLSSVLGYSGMINQTDYAFSNKWLDTKVVEIKTNYPHINCKSFGFSLWGEKGMAKNLGITELLDKLGVQAILTKTGLKSFFDLIESPQTNLVITGRLHPKLEKRIFPPIYGPPHRFEETIFRAIPSTELVFEFALSEVRDPYLSDHKIDTTFIWPLVMALETIILGAVKCRESKQLPSIHHLKINKAIIVPRRKRLKVRTSVLAHSASEFFVQIKTEADGFRQANYEAICRFDNQESCPLLEIPVFEESLEISLNQSFKQALFQGPFFKRTKNIRQLEKGRLCITEVQLPYDHEMYFHKEYPQSIVSPFPAARDAFLQNLLMIHQQLALPVSVDMIKFWNPYPKAGSTVICKGEVIKWQNSSPISSLEIYSKDGLLLEQIKGVSIRTLEGQNIEHAEMDINVLSALELV